MKVGIYNPRVGTRPSGGTETFLREMIARIDADVVLVTGTGTLVEGIRDSDATVIQVPLTYKENRVARAITNTTPVLGPEIESVAMYANARRAGAFEKLEQCDVVSTHYYLDNVLVSRRLDTPTIFRFPGIKQPSPRWRLMFKYDDANRYVSNSQATTDRVTRWYNRFIAETVYAGVDTDRFRPVGDYSITDPMTVLFVGRLEDGKGLQTLIDAVKQCDETVALSIVGDGDNRQQYEEHAAATLAAEEYTFHGKVDHSMIHQHYRDADVFALPSEHESFGIAIMEAMACGLPVIGPRVDAVEDYLTNSENGLLLTHGYTGKLAAYLHTLYKNQGLRKRLGEAARETALGYSWETQAERMTDIYREVAES